MAGLARCCIELDAASAAARSVLHVSWQATWQLAQLKAWPLSRLAGPSLGRLSACTDRCLPRLADSCTPDGALHQRPGRAAQRRTAGPLTLRAGDTARPLPEAGLAALAHPQAPAAALTAHAPAGSGPVIGLGAPPAALPAAGKQVHDPAVAPGPGVGDVPAHERPGQHAHAAGQDWLRQVRQRRQGQPRVPQVLLAGARQRVWSRNRGRLALQRRRACLPMLYL